MYSHDELLVRSRNSYFGIYLLHNSGNEHQNNTLVSV